MLILRVDGRMRKAYSEARIQRIMPGAWNSSTRRPSLAGCGGFSTLCACHPPRDRASFRWDSSKKIDFAHRSDVAAGSGSRELRSVKVPASSKALRLPKCRKNDLEKVRFL